MTDETHGREISLDQLMTLRASTEAIGTWLRNEMEDRLDTLKALLAPRRHLGGNVKGPGRVEESAHADRLFEKLQAGYQSVAGEPLRLPGKLIPPLDAIPNKLEIHSWEYGYEIKSGKDSRRVTIQSPVSWILLYASPLTFAQARQMLSGGTSRNEADVKQFAIRALLMKLVLERMPGLGRLLKALRVDVDVVTCPETGKLPLVRLTSCLPAFRPADSAILSATQLSGVPKFEELVDLDAVNDLPDPIKDRVLKL